MRPRFHPWKTIHDIIHNSSMKIHVSQRTETEKMMITSSGMFHRAEIFDQYQNMDFFNHMKRLQIIC